MALLLKDPLAALDYAVDWGLEYLDGDSVAESSWSVNPAEPGGVEVSNSRLSGAVTTVTAAGGIAGRIYQLSNHVVLASGLTDSRSIIVRVEAR